MPKIKRENRDILKVYRVNKKENDKIEQLCSYHEMNDSELARHLIKKEYTRLKLKPQNSNAEELM